jgi:hypothetical protein
MGLFRLLYLLCMLRFQYRYILYIDNQRRVQGVLSALLAFIRLRVPLHSLHWQGVGCVQDCYVGSAHSTLLATL